MEVATVAYNGSGVYVRAEADYVFDTVIDETAVNNEMDDIATALSGCITKDGQSTPTASIPMNSNKFTGLATGSARTDSVNLGQVQDGAMLHGGTAGGTVDAITFSTTPTFSSYGAGQRVNVIAAGANTGAMTANANSIGAVAIKKRGGTALDAGDVVGAGFIMDLIHDGTDYELQNPGLDKSASASETAEGLVERATQAETNTGTDTTRYMSPANLKSHLTTPNPIGAVTPSTGAFSLLSAATSLALATGATVTGIADEDDMSSDSPTLIATQQSIKAYADSIAPSYKIGTFSWDTSTTGAQAVTGVGFLPTMVVFWAVRGSSTQFSVGGTDGTSHFVAFHEDSGSTWSNNSADVAISDQAVSQTAKLTHASFDADGFTVTKGTVAGSPSGTTTMYFAAFR